MIKNNIAISIVSFNSKDIFQTLDNLIEKILPYFACTVYIIDNNSEPSYKEKLALYQSERILIEFYPKNMGFGFGHNKIASNLEEEFLLVCNPDILVDCKNLEYMVEFLKSNQRILVAPKVVYPNGDIQYLFRRKLDVFDYALRFIPSKTIKKIFNKRLAYFECRDLSEEIQEVKFASGCFMLMRTTEFREVAGFDERFFMYFEDNDLCQKFRLSNMKIIYLPDAKVIHSYGKEAHKSKTVFKIFMSSMLSYFNKWGWKLF